MNVILCRYFTLGCVMSMLRSRKSELHAIAQQVKSSTFQLIENQRGIIGFILRLRNIYLVHQLGMNNLPPHLRIDLLIYTRCPVLLTISINFWNALNTKFNAGFFFYQLCVFVHVANLHQAYLWT